MNPASAFKEQILKVRREVQLSCDSKSLLRTLNEAKRCLDGLAKEPNHALCVAHLSKELIDWISMKQDRDVETTAGKACFALLEALLSICHDAQEATRSFLVARLYNAIIALNGKSACSRTKLRVCRLMSNFTIVDEVAELFGRVKRVVLKTVQEDAKASASSETADEGLDLVIEMQKKLLKHASSTPRGQDGTRQAALTLFREVFDNGMAMMLRIFSLGPAKAQKLYQTVMDTMATVVNPDEAELASLLDDSVSFVETILSYGGSHPEYGQFVEFLTLFQGLKSEPYANCYHVLHRMVKLIQLERPKARYVEDITERIRTISGTHPTHPMVVKVAIFAACQSTFYLHRLPQDVTLSVSHAAINLVEVLMPFVRHCTPDSMPDLCRKCTSTRRHMADKLLNVLVYINIFQARDAVEQRSTVRDVLSKLSYSVHRGCELIKRKLTLLGELNCERKQSMIEISLRYGISWVKNVLTLLREDTTSSDGLDEIVTLLKLLISVQNRYRFEFLPDVHLVRLLENSYVEHPGDGASVWSNVSVRLLKLLLALREPPTAGSGEEQHSSSINSIIRAIMCYQMNAPEQDPIRSLTVVELFGHPSFDRHGFAFECVLDRAEMRTILAMELALVSKYKTSTSIPVWEYFLQLAKLGDVRENCLTFGMALHGFSENDAAKIPGELMEELTSGLTAYDPKGPMERVKRSASLAMCNYLSFSLLSRASLKRMRDVPFKVDHFRNDQIDTVLLENQIDRDAQLTDHMEAIRLHYGDMVSALAEESFRSLWVIPSIAQLSSILDNTARLFHLNYHTRRAVELQLLNLVLVSQRRAEKPFDQCSPLVFLLEHHHVTEELLREGFPFQGGEKWPPHAGGSLGTMEELARRAVSLLHPFPENVAGKQKFHLLNLYLGLAVYRASRDELELALKLIRRALGHLSQPSSEAGSDEDSGDTIGQLIRGRTAQILFRLTTDYGLPWPENVPPLAFMRLLLVNFNELQKLPTEHTFTLSLATMEVTIKVLQHLIVRYDTGPMVEPHVEQLLKFVLRRGAGLRTMQLLLLYGQMCADLEKLDRCELTLKYLDRLLMLRSILSEKGKEDDQTPNKGRPFEYKGMHHSPMELSSESSISTGSSENFVDEEREATPNHRKLINKLIGEPFISAADMTEVPAIEQYLMFHHSPSCDCRYCCYPQYKLMAFQTAALVSRLFLLQRTKTSKQIDHYYRLVYEHWRTEMEPLMEGSGTVVWCSLAYRSDLVGAVIRMLLQRGQCLVRRQCYEPAGELYNRALDFADRESKDGSVTIDPALIGDVRFNRTMVEMLLKRASDGYSVRKKRPRSMIESRFNEMCSKKAMVTLHTELNKLNMKTPKVGPSSVASRSRVPPNTVDRVNELIRQAASRRHQLKTGGTDHLAPDGTVPDRTYSSSARKPKTIDIFVDSPPRRRANVLQPPATVGGKLKPVSTPSSIVIKPKPARKLISETVDRIEVDDVSDKGVQAKSHQSKQDGKPHQKSPLKRPLVSSDRTEVESTPSYKDTLVKSTLPCTPSSRAMATAKSGRKVRRLVVDPFPSLSESSDTDASTKTPQGKKKVPNGVDFSSPALNRSFRDALVLGSTKKQVDTGVIVLDDSNELSRQSDDAIETSFVTSHAILADEHSGLSLKSYSDRKRLLGSGTGSATAIKRRTPLQVTKTKLRFDDPSPDHNDQDDAESHKQREVTETGSTGSKSKPSSKEAPGKTGKTTRARVKKGKDPVIPPETTEPPVVGIATRTRLRRKKA